MITFKKKISAFTKKTFNLRKPHLVREYANFPNLNEVSNLRNLLPKYIVTEIKEHLQGLVSFSRYTFIT